MENLNRIRKLLRFFYVKHQLKYVIIFVALIMAPGALIAQANVCSPGYNYLTREGDRFFCLADTDKVCSAGQYQCGPEGTWCCGYDQNNICADGYSDCRPSGNDPVFGDTKPYCCKKPKATASPPTDNKKPGPILADCGCRFPNGTITANFVSKPFGYWLLKVGDEVSVATLGGGCQLLNCTGGRKISYGDLSMTVSQIDTSVGKIFNFILSGK